MLGSLFVEYLESVGFLADAMKALPTVTSVGTIFEMLREEMDSRNISKPVVKEWITEWCTLHEDVGLSVLDMLLVDAEVRDRKLCVQCSEHTSCTLFSYLIQYISLVSVAEKLE